MSKKQGHWSDLAQQAQTERLCSGHTETVDYPDWARFAMWSPDTAIALSFGLEPHDVSWEEIEKRKEKSKLAYELWRARKRLIDAQAAGDISLPVSPHRYMDWIEARGIVVPSELVKAVNSYGRPVPDWRSRCQELERKLTSLKKEKSTRRRKKEFYPKDEQSLLKLVLGMAIKSYHYVPDSGNTSATANIANALASVGISIDKQTVLKWLQRAAREIDCEPPKG